MIDLIDKKQMYDSVITGKENASNEWNCIVSISLTSFNVYFVFGYAYFMFVFLKTAIWLFLGQGLAFFDEERLATLPVTTPDRCYVPTLLAGSVAVQC